MLYHCHTGPSSFRAFISSLGTFMGSPWTPCRGTFRDQTWGHPGLLLLQGHICQLLQFAQIVLGPLSGKFCNCAIAFPSTSIPTQPDPPCDHVTRLTAVAVLGRILLGEFGLGLGYELRFLVVFVLVCSLLVL